METTTHALLYRLNASPGTKTRYSEGHTDAKMTSFSGPSIFTSRHFFVHSAFMFRLPYIEPLRVEHSCMFWCTEACCCRRSPTGWLYFSILEGQFLDHCGLYIKAQLCPPGDQNVPFGMCQFGRALTVSEKSNSSFFFYLSDHKQREIHCICQHPSPTLKDPYQPSNLLRIRQTLSVAVSVQLQEPCRIMDIYNDMTG